jgi:hypothetical protein
MNYRYQDANRRNQLFFMHSVINQKKLNENRIKLLKKETEKIVILTGLVSVPIEKSKLSTDPINRKIIKFNKNLNAKLSPLKKRNENIFYRDIYNDNSDRKNRRLSPICENLIINEIKDSKETKKNESFNKLQPLKHISKNVIFSDMENESNDKTFDKMISVLGNDYEIKYKTATENKYQMRRSRFFTKKHLFDVYLDDSSREEKEMLPPLINEYKEATRLKYIQKFNLKNPASFKNLKMNHNFIKSNNYKTFLSEIKLK